MNKNPIRVLIFAALVLAGCRDERRQAEPEAKPLQVAVHAAVERRRAATEAVPGTVKAKHRAFIEAKISGRVEDIPVSVGQRVEQGQLLALVEAREIKARLDQAAATREQAERDLERFRALVAQKAVTRMEFDGAETKARVARAAVEEAQAMLAYTRVNAPFAGVITRKLINAGDLAAPGKPLFEMEDPALLRFEAAVPESLIAGLSPGMEVTVRIFNLPEGESGTVAEISPVADPNSRTYLVKFDLPPREGLRSGQFGHVEVALASDMDISLPASAVLSRGQLELVYVVRNGRAEMRLVRSGKRHGHDVEILSGIEPGEQVIVSPAAALRDGDKVEVR